MEWLIVIILVVLAVFVILAMGDKDNNKPVSEWSNEKLKRMQYKLMRASVTAQDAGRNDQATSYYEKIYEIDAEIERRNIVSTVLAAKASMENVMTSEGAGVSIGELGVKMAAIYSGAMKKHGLSQESAYELIDERIKLLEKRFMDNGESEEVCFYQSHYDGPQRVCLNATLE